MTPGAQSHAPEWAFVGALALGLVPIFVVPVRVEGPIDRPQAATDEPPAGLSRDDWSQLRGAVEEASYHPSRVQRPGHAPALVAPNPKQRYQTEFHPDGIQIVSQPAAGKDWKLAVHLTGYGYEGDLRPLPAAEPVADKQRVEYRHGPVTEWYENRPGGLEQAFELDEPRHRRNEPLVIAMAVQGDLDVAARSEGAAFTDGSGTALIRYAGIEAWDAQGRPLEARVVVVGREVRLVVEAQSARFPVTVDPVFIHEAQLLAPDGTATAYFGDSVSVSGDTVVVGASRGTTPGGFTGSAHVFVRSGTAWTEQQKLTASDAAEFDFFGESVSISGDTVVVGAYAADTPSGLDAGAAYVFVRSGTLWTEQQKFVAPDGAAGDFFGAAVSVSGDTAVVGANHDSTPGGADAGSAYVFVRSGTTWTEQQKLTASDGAAGDSLGSSVAVDADTVVAGAHLADTTGGPNAGSAYVFVRSGTTWTEQQKLTASDGAQDDLFGVPVSVSGGTLLVGASQDSTPGGSFVGSAYVFVRSGTTWTQQQKLTASDGAANDMFGRSVSVSGDTAVVGAYGDDNPGGGTGSAYVFVRSGTTWSEQQKLTAPDGAPNDGFGWSASISGDTLVVGADFDDTPAGPDAGSAHVFREERADLSVTKTDGQSTAVPGQPVSYTITVANAGPTDSIGASLTDTLAAVLQGATWTCAASAGSSCTASGSGSINDSVDLLAGGMATYALTGTIDPAATGTLANTATVSAPSGATDPDPTNNTASDTDTLTPEADLSATKTDGQAIAIPGGLVIYTITVANAGPSAAAGATVTDVLPVTLLGATWTCSASSGSSCTASGSGSINDTVNLLAGGSATYTLTATVDAAATGTVVNTASAGAPGGTTDPNPSNNSATDTDALLVGLSIEGELVHGYRRQHDLAALPGPIADRDVFRILQNPHASYEVLLDGASGDLGSGSGPLLDRLASDASTVVQTSSAAGAGGSRSLRWINALDVHMADEFVRVQSAGCTTTCDPSDVYRLSAWETTGFIPRFNNSGTQVTVLVLQNLGEEGIDVDVRFWNGGGTSLGGPGMQTLGPHQAYVLNTSGLVPGTSGGITVASTARYGRLAGKAVAVEPATGFTFDTGMVPRPR